MLYGMLHKIDIPPSDATGNPSIALGSCFLEPIWSALVCNGEDEHDTRSGNKDLRVCLVIQELAKCLSTCINKWSHISSCYDRVDCLVEVISRQDV